MLWGYGLLLTLDTLAALNMCDKTDFEVNHQSVMLQFLRHYSSISKALAIYFVA